MSVQGDKIQADLREILTGLGADEEVATDISFKSVDSAKMFASLANQVINDPTLNLEFGEEDITEKMRHYAAQSPMDVNIEVVGTHVRGKLSKELIEEVDKRAEELGVQVIQKQGPGSRKGKAWMLDL